MKERIFKIRKTFRSKKGETIMECIASLLILAILMVAVTTIIQASLRMTETSTVRAMERQAIANNMIMDVSAGGGIPITFTTTAGSAPEAAEGINASHLVTVHNEDGIIAFTP